LTIASEERRGAHGSSTIGDGSEHNEKGGSVGRYGAAADAVPCDMLNAMF